MKPQRRPSLKSLLDRIRAMATGEEPARPVLLVGGIGAGKTSTGLQLISLLRHEDLPPGGILAPRILEGSETVGYSLIDLGTNTTHPFAGGDPSDIPIGRFHVSAEGLDRARRAIGRAAGERRVVLVDEVGRLELDGGGHAPAVRELLASPAIPILLVRDRWIDEVIDAFALADPILYDVERRDSGIAGAEAFWRIVDAIPFPLLVTHAADGYLTSRPMTAVDRDGASVWLATSRSSHKIAEIAADPRVTLLFVDSVRFDYAALHGPAHLVDDPDRASAVWRDDWRDDWPDGPSDPDYVLMRVDGVRGQYLRGETGETGTLTLA